MHRGVIHVELTFQSCVCGQVQSLHEFFFRTRRRAPEDLVYANLQWWTLIYWSVHFIRFDTISRTGSYAQRVTLVTIIATVMYVYILQRQAPLLTRFTSLMKKSIRVVSTRSMAYPDSYTSVDLVSVGLLNTISSFPNGIVLHFAIVNNQFPGFRRHSVSHQVELCFPSVLAGRYKGVCYCIHVL